MQSTSLSLSDSLAPSISDSPLYKKQIVFSISNASFNDALFLDTCLSLADMLVQKGMVIAYGGDLRKDGFAQMFSEIAERNKEIGFSHYLFINYFTKPQIRLHNELQLGNFLEKYVDIKIIPAPIHLQVDEKKKYSTSKVEERFILTECNTAMRIEMSSDAIAGIAIGGSMLSAVGLIPGVIEEAYHVILQNKPLYVIGGFGGAANVLTHLIAGTSEGFTEEKTLSHNYLLEQLEEYVRQHSVFKLLPDKLLHVLSNYSLDKLSEKNGLSIEENKILFNSTDIIIIRRLVEKGLQRIATAN